MTGGTELCDRRQFRIDRSVFGGQRGLLVGVAGQLFFDGMKLATCEVQFRRSDVVASVLAAELHPDLDDGLCGSVPLLSERTGLVGKPVEFRPYHALAIDNRLTFRVELLFKAPVPWEQALFWRQTEPRLNR